MRDGDTLNEWWWKGTDLCERDCLVGGPEWRGGPQYKHTCDVEVELMGWGASLSGEIKCSVWNLLGLRWWENFCVEIFSTTLHLKFNQEYRRLIWRCRLGESWVDRRYLRQQSGWDSLEGECKIRSTFWTLEHVKAYTWWSSCCGSVGKNPMLSLKRWVWSLASLSGLRSQCCCELLCSSQMQLGSCVTVAVV